MDAAAAAAASAAANRVGSDSDGDVSDAIVM